MDNSHSESQILLRNALREYLAARVPSARLHELEASGDFDQETWAYLAEGGFLGLPVPADLGGQGGSLLDLAVMVEECSRRPATIPLVETMACLLAALHHGSGEAREAIVGGVPTGRLTLAPAIIEPGNRPEIAMTETGGRITGSKRFVDYGANVTHHLVAARNGDIGLYLVDGGGEGVSRSRLRTIGGTPLADVTYDNVPAQRVAGRDAYEYLLRLGRGLAALQSYSMAQRALDITVEYVGVRVQFGRPIGTFQAVQHHCANMATMTTACRFLVYEALWKLEAGVLTESELAIAKAFAARTATEVPMMAHQLHGGIGITKEYDLQFLSRRARERAVSWGSAEDCLGVVADALAAPVGA